MTRIDDLRLLRAFVQIAESGSISAASRVLGVSQPTLSRRIQVLERSLNTPLIQRDTHSLSLTESGRVLLNEARGLLAQADQVSQRLLTERTSLQGHLRIVSVVDIGQWIVPRILAQFQTVHPQVTAELHLINRPMKFVKEGFDCGFYIGEPIDKSLVMRPLTKLSRVLVAPPSLLARYGTPGSPKELIRLPWLGVLQPHFDARTRVVLSSGKEIRKITLNPTLLLDTVTALRQAALAGAGFTMLPSWMVEDDLASGELVSLLDGWSLADMDLCICYAASGHLSNRLRAFLNFVQEEMPNLVA